MPRGNRKKKIQRSSNRLSSLKSKTNDVSDNDESFQEDRRLPEEKNALLLWAEQYHAANERTPDEVARDEEIARTRTRYD